jgi:anti-anti-sigma factor
MGHDQGSIFYAMLDGHYVIKFVGEVRLTLCSALDQHLESILSQRKCEHLLVDLTDAEFLDSTTLGLIAKIAIRAKERRLAPPVLVSTHEDVTRMLMSMGFDSIFVILDTLPENASELKEIPMVQESVDTTQERIISAHKVLMSLNQANHDAFSSLITALEEK